ncbi:MAG: aminodeoxychorismate synthase component I [Bacteroidetes bacterium]|nr:aminodeoxychorismate synthase component I [Bacteroidota bacterium]MBL6943921.1 aminodeoxychorismate synthase component I [Bacteroidales bacterium]
MQTTINRINQFGKKRIPFLFIIDFDMEKPIVLPLNEIDSDEILYSVNGISNINGNNPECAKEIEFKASPVSKERYLTAFNHVQKHIRHGDSFLLNLTMPSKIETNLNLKEIFACSKAKYKLLVKDQFVVFSPEIFIKTIGRKISSFPMKGTMDAALPDAEQKLLNSEKELAEHYTIVDLIRNDLSMVAKNVKVDRFRFIDKLKTNRGGLLQMSSEISGELPENYHEIIGEILIKMLPAGSISGAPKKKTIEIIREAEQYKRGYYTGIFGIFDGENIDSGVMIRYIEQKPDGLIYKSGGGITAKSNVDEEYQELIDKIYIPL